MNSLMHIQSHKKDQFEHVGDAAFLMLTAGFGRMVRIEATSQNHFLKFDDMSVRSVYHRVAAAALSVLMYQVTVVLAVVGLTAYAISRTRRENLKLVDERINFLDWLSRSELTDPNDVQSVYNNIDGYVPVEVTKGNDLVSITKEFHKKVSEQMEEFDSTALVKAKTIYFKQRDIFEAPKESVIPESKIELELSSLTEFNSVEIPKKQIMRRLSVDANAVLDKKFKNRTPEELLQLIFELHSVFSHDNEIRTQFRIVQDPRLPFSYEAGVTNHLILIDHEEGSLHAKRVKSVFEKWRRWGNIEQAVPYITADEWKSLQKVAYIPPKPEGLQEKALNFLTRAHQLMNDDKYHPVQVAAFLHFGISALHLFADCNGRLARYLSNLYLIQSGYEKFDVFEGDVLGEHEYFDLFKAEKYDIAFRDYLLNCWSYEESEAEMSGCESEEFELSF